MTEEEKADIIETIDEEGNPISFKLFDVIEYNGNEYAMLLPIDEEQEDEDDPELVLMRLIAEGDEYSLETIEDEDEFNEVAEYIESLGDED